MLNFERRLFLKKDKEAEHLHYDMLSNIKQILPMIGKNLPEDYKDLYKDLKAYSKQKVKKPKNFDYPFRYYLVTSSFDILFIMYNKTDKHWNKLYSFAKSFFNMSDSPYGTIDELQPDLFIQKSPLPFDLELNQDFISDFSKENGFIPIDSLSLSQLLFFEEDELIVARSISSWQQAMILKWYEKQNIADTKAMADYYFAYMK